MPKNKKYLIAMICSIVAMFLWIFAAVVLTGGRDVGEFTPTDNIIMTLFVVVECTTVVLAMVFAVLTGKEYGKRFRQTANVPKTKEEKTAQRRGTGLLVLAYLIAFGTVIGGIILRGNRLPQTLNVYKWLLGISCAAAVVALALSVLLKKWYKARLEKQQVAQIQKFIYSHRDRAEETAAKKLSFLTKWRSMTAVYAVLLAVLGICIAFCGGIFYSSQSVVVYCFAAAILITGAFSRIRFPVSLHVFDEHKSYISQESYPHIYALAQKAAKEVGCTSSIKIAFLPGFNAGIAKIGQYYSVQLGVILLCALSEEELYSVLLHEFSHVAGENSKSLKESGYCAWLRDGKPPHFLSGITELFFAFFDAVYALQYGLYEYAASIQIEHGADRAMLLCGDPDIAASALLKLKYYDLFTWEKGVRDEACVYEQEQAEQHVLQKELGKFQAAMEVNMEKWNRLLDMEIQSRSATHPTLKLRLEALGIRTPGIYQAKEAPKYQEECRKALDYVDGLICEDLSNDYETRRKMYYLEPKERVDEWEAAGKPVIAQEYADVVFALRDLGRYTEAQELCQRAIETLPQAASYNAYFIRGCHRLHSYDPAGIEDLYTVVEINSNYLDECLDTLGHFCCLTGNRQELDVYREKTLTLAQKYKDEYSQLNELNKKDRLSEENLPEGMLEDILQYIKSIEHGEIEKIYLVRKTITEEFFASVFVIRFDLQADVDACNEIMHKIFRYLDNCYDWQFSLFDYMDVLDVSVYKIKNSCVYERPVPVKAPSDI